MRKTNSGQCVVNGCDYDARTSQMCSAHYARTRRGGDLHDPPLVRQRPRALCDVGGCIRKHYAQGLCTLHYDRKRAGIPFGREIRDGRIRDRKGYILVRTSGRSGYVPEHRVVMEEVLGRALLPGENVHHLNGQRDDNRPENLELWVTVQPAGQRAGDLLDWAHEILRRYGD